MPHGLGWILEQAMRGELPKFKRGLWFAEHIECTKANLLLSRTVLWSCKMLTLGRAGWNVNRHLMHRRSQLMTVPHMVVWLHNGGKFYIHWVDTIFCILIFSESGHILLTVALRLAIYALQRGVVVRRLMNKHTTMNCTTKLWHHYVRCSKYICLILSTYYSSFGTQHPHTLRSIFLFNFSVTLQLYQTSEIFKSD